jgi:isopropylmalate/homocitrate/citramalate synthase
MTPFVGRSFNATRAGIHADGLLKDEEIYTIFDTGKLLNRPAVVEISKTSGLAGIAYWINQNFRLKGDDQIDKHDPVVQTMKSWIDAEYEDGRQTVMTDKELDAMLERLAPGRFRKV